MSEQPIYQRDKGKSQLQQSLIDRLKMLGAHEETDEISDGMRKRVYELNGRRYLFLQVNR